MEELTRRVLVFDMDGVLVDVTDSYRATIVETVRQFIGVEPSREQIQNYKNRGGWNNDWALSQRLIADLGGKDIPYATVVEVFQQYFFGVNGREGLVMRERWIPADGLMAELASRFDLTIFTGRTLDEAQFTLRRFVPEITWCEIVADDVVARSKPAPDGLLEIAAKHPGSDLLYFGDTVDDARSARAAGVPFVGVAHSGNPTRAELVALLQSEGAVAIIENFNEIRGVL
ncbi:MAG: HAD-IA family hydrolase [Bryobacteraceae bacterium]|nr:HAD-IA family hydrolase [Bryobacteraceae bacterium]